MIHQIHDVIGLTQSPSKMLSVFRMHKRASRLARAFFLFLTKQMVRKGGIQRDSLGRRVHFSQSDVFSLLCHIDQMMLPLCGTRDPTTDSHKNFWLPVEADIKKRRKKRFGQALLFLFLFIVPIVACWNDACLKSHHTEGVRQVSKHFICVCVAC